MTDHYDKLAHEIWAVAQLAPGEGVVDGVARIAALLRKVPHPAITHCDKCGCDWLDNGLNPVGCPYCKQPAAVDGARAIDKARFERAPCYLCGYNGQGYYQPGTHPCAAKYHAAQQAND